MSIAVPHAKSSPLCIYDFIIYINKIRASTHKHRQTLGANHTSPPQGGAQADVVRRVPIGVCEESDMSPLQVTHARTHARTHALTHSHHQFVWCQSPIVKALPSASYRRIRQTYADVC
jgi:hypothetical protein